MKRSRGTRVGLTRDQILDAALVLVDRDGLPALTMRALGAELDVEAMTLYHHIPSKTALIDGVVERVFTAAQPDLDEAADWREMLRQYSRSLRSGLLKHPGVLSVIVRPAATPATLDAFERALRVLVDGGFPLGRAIDSLNALTLFVIGHTAAEAAIGPDADPGALDDERHPLLARAVREGAGTDDEARFTYAIDALLEGFASLG